jgi:hypothetical protein
MTLEHDWPSLNLQFDFGELGPGADGQPQARRASVRILNYPGTFWPAKKILQKIRSTFTRTFLEQSHVRREPHGLKATTARQTGMHDGRRRHRPLPPVLMGKTAAGEIRAARTGASLFSTTSPG